MKKLISIIVTLLVIAGALIWFIFFYKSTLQITLQTNGGVPYTWEYSIDDEEILRFKDKKEVPEEEGLAGGKANVNYTFEGLQQGETTLKFEYKSVVDGTVEQVKKYKVTIDLLKQIKIEEIQ